MVFAVTVLAAWLLFVCASPAYAYVDPGAGSMVMQLVLGGVAGVVVLIRLSWQRILSVFHLRGHQNENA